MKSHFKNFFTLLVLTYLFSLFLPCPVYSNNINTSTRIIVVEGKVICFDLPKELVSVTEKEQTATGRFVGKINEETGNVNIRNEITRCYIPQEYRHQIGDVLQTGSYVFLLKNTRRTKQTEWDIISVGTIVGAGQEYSHDVVKQASLEPSVSPSIPPTEAATVNKDEKSEHGGEGGGEPTPSPPTPPSPPTEPTPPAPEPTPTPETSTIYVSSSTGDDGNTGAEDNKLKTITKAIENADSGATIVLSEGTYSTDTGETFPLSITKDITLRGQGDSTVLDGGNSTNVIYIGSVANPTGSATLESLKIQNGNATGAGTQGGAVTIAANTGVITNCTFSNNTSSSQGGAVFSATGNFTVSGCTFSGNISTGIGGGGGALEWVGGNTFNISNCTFTNNQSTNPAATGGCGALWIEHIPSDIATVTNCTFSGNTSASYNGAIKISGATTTINGCTFTNNSANQYGGAVYITNGSTTTITNSTFTSNSVTSNNTGGGVCVDASTATINNSIFKSNTGCAIRRAVGASVTITNSWFYNNNRVGGGTEFDHYYTGVTYYSAGGGGLTNMNTIPGNSGNTEVGAGDPPITGRVYDSVTGENISEPVIGIYNGTTNTQVGVTTDNPYTFNVDPGKYYFAVSKDGYAFPSQIVASTTSGDHGDIFTAVNDPLTINIPMDPDGWLYVEKTCNKERVEAGDIVTYRIKVQNKHWYKAVENVELVDELVNGFKYVGSPTFNLGTVSANSTQTITYQVRVGSGIPPGRYKTSCYTRKSNTLARNSNIDITSIEVIENPLFTKGTIIGKVFWDSNGNGIQDNNESGIKGVSIYTEYGVCVKTDELGKYHIADVPAGNHLLKVDNTTFPSSIKFTTDNPYYVKITEGLLAKVNFGITTSLSLRGVSPDGIGTNDEAIPSEIVSEATLSSASASPRNDNPWANQFFIVALGEGTVRNLNTSGNIAMMDKDDRYDDGVKVDGRLALYLKGKVLGKYLIKASIDTERRPYGRYDTRKLFTNLDPDKYYPVYGDASKVDYSGVDTQDVVYILIQWDESFAKWGSFHTELPLYNRTLSGGIINYNSIGKTKFGNTKTEIKGFGAFSRQIPAHDEYVGTGGSLYYLRHRDVIEGSEKLRVETRDRIGKTVINSIPLKDEMDYEINYDTGKIILKKPLNSVQQGYNDSIISNDILMGERIYLVIDYEYYGDELSNQVYGINASQWLGNHIRVGGTYVEEQKPETSNQKPDNYKLMGGDATIKLNKDTEVNANYSRTEETQLGSTMSYDGGITFTEQGANYSLDKSGSCVNVNGMTKLFNNTDVFLSYSRQDPYYSVSNSISSQGSQKYIGNIITKLTDSLSAGITHITQRYFSGSIAGEIFGATESHTTTGILDYRKNKWDIRAEYEHRSASNPITDYTYFGTLPLLDNDFIAGRIGYQLFSWMHPYVRGQGTIQGEANNQGTAGADINIGKYTTLNLAETYGNTGDSTLLGLTTKVTEGSDVYANLEVGNHTKLGKYTKTTYGQSSQLSPDSRAYIEEDYSSYRENIVRGNILGYNKKITDTLGLGLTYERSNVKNNITAIDRDAGAISLSYLNPDWLKAYTKLELRNDRGSNEVRQWVTENDILWRTTEWLTLTGRGNWGWTENRTDNTDEAQFYELGTGFSIRPVTWDKLNVLGKYSYLTDLPPDSQWDFDETTESRKNVFSIEGIYDLFKYLSLVGKISYRDMEDKTGGRDWVHSDTYLYIARTNFHIMNNEPDKPFILRGWDLGAEYRVLTNDQIEDKKTGWLVELDKDLGNYIRCGVGYNFTDYDDDLRNDDNWDAHGWFMKLAGKY